jgi:arginine/ornithine transport system permease protein
MVADYLPLLLRGAALSLCVMLSSLLVALLLGLINSLIKLFGPRGCAWFSTAYTTLVRGIPELVIMLLLFFGGEMLVNAAAVAGRTWAGAFQYLYFRRAGDWLCFGAYYTETFRGAFLTVDRGTNRSG